VFLQNLVNSLVLGSIYVLIAVGLTLVYGILRILHIAHAGIYAFGALMGLTLYKLTGNILVSMIFSAVLSGFLGILVYRYFYRKVLSESRIVPLVISIGLFVAMQDLYRLIWGPYKEAFSANFNIPDIVTENLIITGDQIFIVLVTVISLVALYFIMNKTRWGKALKACADDLQMTGALGINIERTVMLGFFIGSFLAGLAGVLVGIYDNSVYPTMGEVPSYKAFVVVVLGGFGSLKGAVVAGFILAGAETFLVAWKGFLLPRDAIAFIAMILLLMFKPSGIFGRETG